MKWKILSSEYVIRRPWLTARRDVVELPTGAINPEFYVLEYPDWVNVIAITAEGDFVMIEQYRHGLSVTSIELSAGVIEEGEEPIDAAKRELLEETGYSGGTWRELMHISGNPSTTNNITHCYVAEGVSKSSFQHLDATEDIKVCIMTPDEVLHMLLSDEVKQSLMAAPLWRYFYEKDRNDR